jgi:His/Glu/Gln/Arg/opine family amino acid ABC transporter permease subunit
MRLDPQFLELAIPLLLRGALVTVEFTVVSALFGIVIGLIVALARISRNPLLRGISTAYVEFFRGTPLLVQIFIIAFGLPALLGDWANMPEFVAGVLALSINSGAYTSEIFRAGIQAISRGQMEAGRSLGLSYAQTMWFVIIPQAIRVVVPPLGNELIALLKDSSLVSIIAVTDLMRAGREITGTTVRPFETYTLVALFYLCMTLPLTLLVRAAERRMKTA